MNNFSVLIFGAGSIGNHMAHACSKLNFNVSVTDISWAALLRMKNKIYPKRYKKWNNKINLLKFNKIFSLKKKFSLIIIGTPPNTHLQIFNKCKEKLSYEKILIEKPLCSFKENLKKISIQAKSYNIFSGYNHSISPSINYLFNIMKNKKFGKIKFVDIQWREGWNGILKAHSWINSEFDTYLGNYKLGGGSIQEHSHGLHLAICIMENFFKKPYKMVQKNVYYEKNMHMNVQYDRYSQIQFSNSLQRLNLEIDLFKTDARKEIKVYCQRGNISWIHNFSKNTDAVKILSNKKEKIIRFQKNRSTEFINEIKHIKKIKNKKNYNASRLSLGYALKTMKIIKKFFNGKQT